MAYQAPADRVVLERDPARFAQLIRSSPDYKQLHYLFYSRPEFESYYDVVNAAHFYSVSTIFLHSRTNPAGHKRLVAVNSLPLEDADPDQMLILNANVFCPATVLTDATEPTPQLKKGYPTIFGVERIFAGQADANDLSHFTFVVVTHEKTLHFDGWLLDDETVKLEPREGYPESSTPPPATWRPH